MEKFGYQGQVAFRKAIISNCYTQQALDCLLDTLAIQRTQIWIERAIETVRDIFAMFTKTLHQIIKHAGLKHTISY